MLDLFKKIPDKIPKPLILKEKFQLVLHAIQGD